MIEFARRYHKLNEMDRRRLLRLMDKWLEDYEPAEQKPDQQASKVVLLRPGGEPDPAA
jgi:hypothetical protein